MTQIIEETVTTQNIEERGLFDFTSAAGSVVNKATEVVASAGGQATQAIASVGAQATQAIGDVVQNIENDLVTFKNFALNEINTLKMIKNYSIAILIVLFTMILMFGIANCAQCVGFWWNVPKKIVNFIKSLRGKKNPRGNLNDLPLEERGLNNGKWRIKRERYFNLSLLSFLYWSVLTNYH